jgi:dienelactone hydrolase
MASYRPKYATSLYNIEKILLISLISKPIRKLIMNIQSHIADLDTPTGVMRTYIHRPVGEGKYPTILFYSEIFQQTGPIERAAKVIASHGYAVLVPEVFHELNPIGTVLGLTTQGAIKAMPTNQQKTCKVTTRTMQR